VTERQTEQMAGLKNKKKKKKIRRRKSTIVPYEKRELENSEKRRKR